MYPGDSVTNIFALDAPTGKWYDNYLVTPSRAGSEAGAVPYGGGFTFDPKMDCECLLSFAVLRSRTDIVLLLCSCNEKRTFHHRMLLGPISIVHC